MLFLRFGAGLMLTAGFWVRVAIEPGHPTWLPLSVSLYAAVIALLAVLRPAAHASFGNPRMRRRVRMAGVASSLLALCFAALMVSRPGES